MIDPQDELLNPVVLKDGVLVCNECGQPMTPRGNIFHTLLGYYSPPGHNHDDNCMHRAYECPQGHIRKIAKRRRCPACDWVGTDRCFCHDGLKVDEWPEAPKGETQ